MTHILLACPSCHQKNRVAADKIDQHPNCGHCKARLITGIPFALDVDNIAAHMACDMPVVVDFWASWCAPCRQYSKAFEMVAAPFAEKARFATISTESQPTLAQRYQVRSLPTTAVFQHGHEIARSAGAMPPQHLHQWLDEVLQQASKSH